MRRSLGRLMRVGLRQLRNRRPLCGRIHASSAKKCKQDCGIGAPAVGHRSVSGSSMVRNDDVHSTYYRLSPIEHVLLRPGMYVGSIGSHNAPIWTAQAGKKKGSELLIFKPTKYVPALVKLFDEILVNALDNRTRDAKGTTGLDIAVELSGGASPRIRISILNNGQGLPVVRHRKEKMWVPELVFGHLMTGSNFFKAGAGAKSDAAAEDELSTGGQHGLGAKLSNILSSKFAVETFDSKSGRRFRQTWERNMRDAGAPEVDEPAASELSGEAKGTGLDVRGGYTRIEFEPELSRFELGAHSAGSSSNGKAMAKEEARAALEGSLQVMRRRALDAAAVSGLRVRFNGKELSLGSVDAYAEALRGADGQGRPLSASGRGRGLVRWSPSKRYTAVVRVLSKEERQALASSVGIHGLQSRDGPLKVSFVNGMRTDGGGLHVSGLLEPLAKQCAAIASKELGKEGAGAVSPSLVKSFLQVVVSAQVKNPQFDSQSKDHLVGGDMYVSGRAPPERVAKQVLEAGLMDVLREEAYSREEAAAARDARKLRQEAKRFKSMDVPKLEDANWAGTKRSNQCTLIVTEGDSAKALAVAGLAAVGRDQYGVFPLRGKLLNVRGMKLKQALQNEEIANLVKILGIDPSCSYLPGAARTKAALGSLRYGRLMIMADQDTDGSHIKGLVMNVFHSLFPGLVRRQAPKDNFLQLFITPVVKARSNKGPRREVEFFSVHSFRAWLREQGPAAGDWRVKYYKGLGTSTAEEGRTYFRDLDKHRIDMSWQGEYDDDRLALAFDKERAGDRKAWLLSNEGAWGVDEEEAGVGTGDVGVGEAQATYSRFVDDELVHFSLADVRRSIPSAVDGLKPSQRKVLFACFKRQGSFAGKEGRGSDAAGTGAAGDLKKRLAPWMGRQQPGTNGLPGATDLRLMEDPDQGLLVDARGIADADASQLAAAISGLTRGARGKEVAEQAEQEELKVSQLAGFVGEQSAYHHGEASLNGAIIGMAQSFVGSNNVPLLLPLGQFGTRLQGGKDAASPRYVYTRLSPLARLLLPRADDALLDRVTDDGELVEPRFFCPVAPIGLMNGAEGIGTGWSTQVPQFHPVAVVDATLDRIRREGAKGSNGHQWGLDPWYRGFGGDLRVDYGDRGASALLSKGRARVLSGAEAKAQGLLKRGAAVEGDSQWVEVVELPLKRWTDDFKKTLHRLTSAGEVEDVQEHHTETKVRFLVQFADGVPLSEAALDKKLRLSGRAAVSNMHLIGEDGMIRQFHRPDDILDAHAETRMRLYRERLNVAGRALDAEAARSREEAAFVGAVSGGKLQLTGVPMDQVVQRMHEAGIGRERDEAEGGQQLDAAGLRRRYEPLLRLPLASLTTENSARIYERAEVASTTADVVRRMDPATLWEAELLDARAGLQVWCGMDRS